MTVSGPTACGKTHFVKELLQKNVTLISPPPQRIIWLYRRWQPVYDVIRDTVYPQVEFVEGIPIDLDQNSFIHPGSRNLVILDDLMSSAAKDCRINDLFTEGSHHRNLSVIAINQNLYHSKDPTQRRNCHYLALFNNPIDKQQIMTLARQMYPDDTKYFMGKFREATSKPYGYLLVDLKPTTPESLRLRSNILKDRRSSQKELDSMNGGLPDSSMYAIDDMTESDNDSSEEDIMEMNDDWSSCQRCGQLFVTQESCAIHEVKCGSNHKTSVWKTVFLPNVLEEVKETIDSDVDKRISSGMNVTEANVTAYNNNLPMMRKLLMWQYLEFMIKIKDDVLHREILNTADKLKREFDMNEEEALKKATETKLHLLKYILPNCETSEN